MSRRSLNVASAVVVVLLTVSAFVVWRGGEDGDGSAPPLSDGAGAVPARVTALPVTAEVARRDRLVMRITATGTAEADRLLKVVSEVDGKIESISVVEGQVVEAGQVLVGLDDRELRMARDTAEEALLKQVMDFAKDQLVIPGDETIATGRSLQGVSASEYLRGLISAEAYQTIQGQPDLQERLDAMTREDLVSALATLTAQRVHLEQAELDLQRARIAAPFGGKITGLDTPVGPNAQAWPVVGQRVTSGTELMMLVDADPIRLRVEVIESEIGLIQEGRRAEVSFAAYPGETFTGMIEAISPIVNAERRSLSVTVTLANPGGRLRPGMFAQVLLDTEIFENRLLVPASAALLRDDRWVVFVIRDGRAQWEYVTKGLENPDSVELLDGVSAGDLVVTGGHFTLAHDTPVEVVNEPPGADGGEQRP